MIEWKEIENRVRTEQSGDCLLITHPKMYSRTVRMSFKKQKINVRKVFYESTVEEIGKDRMLFCTCGNSNCLNTDHLQLIDIHVPKPPKEPVVYSLRAIKTKKLLLPCPELFYQKIKVEKKEGGCWDSGIKARAERPYPTVHFKHHQISTHRFAYTCFVGAIPQDKIIMHKCDNPRCCNPEHLQLGTLSDNTQDMISKGRACRDGIKQKLTRQDRIDIRQSDLSSYQLAEIYPVTATHIRRIRNGTRCR